MENLAHKVLHHPAGLPNGYQQAQMVRAAQLYAIDHDGNGPAAWAAQDLRWSAGLFVHRTVPTTDGGFGLVLIQQSITKLDSRMGGRGYFLIAEVEADGVAVTWPNGAHHRLPFDEVTELVVLHLRLLTQDRSVPVALAVSGDPGGRQTLARTIADRTGRRVYTKSAGLTVSPADANGTFRLVPATTPNGAPSNTSWVLTEPHRPHFESIQLPSGTAPGGTNTLAQDLGADAALADGLRVRPEVTGDPVQELAVRLPGLSGAEREAALALLAPAHREQLAADPVLVDTLRARLAPAEFASVAAYLITQVPDGVEQPVTAGNRARAQVTQMLQDPDVAARLLKGGSRVVVVPRSQAMTSLDAFRDLQGGVTADGRSWQSVRGATQHSAAVTEENLLGERSTVPFVESAQADGYSTTVHEIAHTIHFHGLDDADKKLISDAYDATQQAGAAGAWPDGALYGHDADGSRTGPNYSSLNQYEFFAQLTNVYFMANAGTDPYTGLPRNNGGPDWVEKHHNRLHRLLVRLYGENPRGTNPAAVNPTEATDTEN